MNSNTPTILRLILNQFVMSVFGIMLTMSTISVDSTLCALVSCIAVFLYFFLIYNVMWEKGAREVIKSQHTHKNTITKGFVTALLAAIPTIVLTVIFSCITEDMTNVSNFANTLYTVTKLVLSLGFQGMYHGIAQLFSYHFVFYIIMIFPAILLGGLAYVMGYKNIRIIPEKKKQ